MGSEESIPGSSVRATRLASVGVYPPACALPPGRKIDPTFDMNDFRLQVAAIMAGTAPLPYVISSVDGEGRKYTATRGEGESGQASADEGWRDSTEAAVRRFQRDYGLVPDGIVGPRT